MTQQTSSQATAKRTPMSRETLEARAIQRARDLRTHVLAVPGQPGVYTCTSSEDKGRKYNLVLGPDGIVGCACEGFFRRQNCRHAAALEARLAREQVRAERQMRHAAAVERSLPRAEDVLWN